MRGLRSDPILTTIACALAGVAHALSFAPWNLPLLELAALAALAMLAGAAASWRHAAACGFAFGLGWFGAGVSWVYISMHTFGGMPALISALAAASLAAYLSLFPALAAGASAALGSAGMSTAQRQLLAWPPAWTLSEMLRGWLLTGMPWIASGYAHTDGPLAGYAPLAGVYGITLAAAFIAGAAALLAAPAAAARVKLAAAAAALALLAAGQVLRPMAYTAPEGPAVTVALIQGNVAQDLKFGEDGVGLAARRYLPLLADAETARADLVVLPESAFPVPLNDLPPELLETLNGFAADGRRALVFGAFVEEPRGHFYNSAIGLQGTAPAQRYAKRHLVPFGEFIPFGFRWFVDLMQMPIGDQEHGASHQGPMHLAGQRLAIDICFENLFGREVLDAWDAGAGAGEPTMLLNLSNLAWFGSSVALPQHLQFSRMRALETGRPLLQATNSGLTAVIDAAGRVQASLAQDEQAADLAGPGVTARRLMAQVRGYRGSTPYVRAGDAPALLAALLMLAAAAGVSFASARRRGAPMPPGA